MFVLLLDDIVKLGLQCVTFRTQEVAAFARLLPVVKWHDGEGMAAT